MSQLLFYGSVTALLVATILPLLVRAGIMRKLALMMTAASCAALFAWSAQLFFGLGNFSSVFYSILPSIQFAVSIDRLAAFFIMTISLIALSVAIYSIPYVEHHYSAARRSLLVALMNMFILSMIMVVASSTFFSFLFFWELMSLSSFFLVMFDYEKRETRKAGLFYFIMTHLSMVCLLFAFLTIYHFTGSMDISAMTAAVPALASNIIFLALFTGFCVKAGVIPFHKWLPYAHPASPSNISALMSGIMIKVAIYGLARFLLSVLPPALLWWGVLILIAGTVSALLGVIYALKEHDIKRLLAYHSVENIGIILIGFGLFLIFDAVGMPQLALLGLVGSLFHTLNHALFKSLLFLTAGSIVSATGTKNIEEMGGLIKRMPYTSFLFLVGAISISALPPFNGFVSELMIFQAFLQSHAIAMPLLNVLLIICLSVFALTSALAAACFVKAFGITFLAMPRSSSAEKAKEAPLLMLIGPAILALCCVLLGVFSFQLIELANFAVDIPNMAVIGLLLLVSYALVFLFLKVLASSKVRRSETWGCGLLSQNSKMEYTASGFSEPIVTIFQPIYHTHKYAERNFFDRYQSIFKDGVAEIHLFRFFEEYLYMPVVRVVRVLSRATARLQEGNLDAYIFYVFAASIVLLLAVGWFA